MVSAILRGTRVLALPARPEPGTLYFLRGEGDTFTLYLTGKGGVVAAASVEAAALPAAVLESLGRADTAVQPGSLATVAVSGTYGDLTGIPATFAPATHTHPAAEISDATAAGLAVLRAANAAGQRLALGLGSAAVAAILGTVAQSGGVPTGAVIERGSNANGDYLRLADGTQICTRIIDLDGISLTTAMGPLYRSDNVGPFAFPASFVNANAVQHVEATLHASDNTLIRNSAVGARLRRGQSTKSLAWDGIALVSAASVTGTAGEITRLSLLAIGRWF